MALLNVNRNVKVIVRRYTKPNPGLNFHSMSILYQRSVVKHGETLAVEVSVMFYQQQ